MKRVMTEKDSDRSILKGARIAVVGFGSQGKAHALNLRDSGLDVVIGLRPGGPTAKAAQEEGLKVLPVAEAVRGAKIVCMLVPDMAQAEVYRNDVEPNLADGALLMFSHGFNIHYNQITPKPTIDVAMVAPKSPGRLVRTQYEAGRGVPCVLAVHQNATGKAFDLALAYADGIGGTRAGVIETTFAEETETDLFGEQAVLCGGVTELITAGFETLVEAGYQPEVAYFECLHELKLIVDLIYEGGIARMHKYVSDTAKYGDLTRGPRIVDDHVRAKMKEILGEIRSGAFASEWVLENKAGAPRYKALLAQDLQQPIEEVGARLRSMMSWLEK